MTPETPTRGRLSLVEASVQDLPSTMARLAHLAALRDQNTLVYSHPIAQTGTQKAEAAQLLKHMHEQAFRSWLNYSLEQQKTDLDLYLSGLGCDRATVVKTWLDLESYRCFVPASATAAERQLFFSDLAALLRTMAGPAPGADQRMAPSGNGDALLTTAEVAQSLGVAPRTLRLWAECGEIPAVKVGRQWRLRRTDIEEKLKPASG